MDPSFVTSTHRPAIPENPLKTKGFVAFWLKRRKLGRLSGPRRQRQKPVVSKSLVRLVRCLFFTFGLLILAPWTSAGSMAVRAQRDVTDLEIGVNDFRISNTPDTTGNLGATLNADVAYNPDSDEYLVVWEAQEFDVSPFEYEIFSQLLAGDGTPIGSAVQISYTGVGTDGSVAREPAVAYNATDHEYLVVWFSDEYAAHQYDIFGLRLDASGMPIGSLSFPVSKMDGTSFSRARGPDVVWDPDGDRYLVVWQGIDSSAGTHQTSEIFGQLLAPDGTRLPPYEVRISSMGDDGDPDATTMALSPAVAYNPNSAEFLIVWEGDDSDLNTTYRSEIYGQRLDSSLAEIGADFLISETGLSAADDLIALRPDVAYNADSDQYMVVWQGEGTGIEDAFEIFAQRLDSSAKQIDTGPQSGKTDHRISTMGPPAGDPDYDAHAPRIVAIGGADQYFVVWSADRDLSPLVDGEFEIYGQHLDGFGNLIGSHVRLSDMGDVDGDADFDGVLPAMAQHDDRILFVWTGDDATPGDDDGEAWGQLFVIPVHVIGVFPVSLSFGNRNVHAGPSPPQTMTITNEGAGTLEITSVDLVTGTQFVIASDTGEPTLGAGDSRLVEIAFDPTSEGAKTDLLRITSNDPSNPTADVALDGIGIAQAVEVAPQALDFGSQDVEAGQTPAQMITITNTGTDALTVNSVSLEDISKTAAEFIIVFDSGETLLDPSEFRTVEIAFDPIFIAPSEAVCRIDSDDPDSPIIDVALTGIGLAPEYVTIPDANFKACLLATYDTLTPDGEISVREAENIADISCSGLGIQDITGTQACVNLVQLDVSFNAIPSLPDLAGLSSLLTVDCAHNRLTTLETPSRSLALPANLSWLILGDNALSELPGDFPLLSYLVELDLSQNRFMQLPDQWNLFLLLEVLDLESNALNELPASVGLMPALLALDVGANRLTALPTFDATCPITHLWADRNLLDSLPNLTDLVHLEYVILSRNRLTDLTPFVLHPDLGTAAPHVLHVDRNLLTATNCPDILLLEARFAASGAEFIYNPQGHFSSVWPSLTLWPTENVLTFVALINAAAFEYDLICPSRFRHPLHFK